MPRSIHFQYQPESACIFHRVVQPVRFCHEPYTAKGFDIRIGEGLDESADILAVNGLPPAAVLVPLCRLKRKGRRIVWSVDDDWLTVPESNPAKPTEDALISYDLLKGLADVILCSTPYLARTFRDVAEKVVTAPNLLDPDLFPAPHPLTVDSDGHFSGKVDVQLPIRVVWSGGCTHKDDLEVIGGACERVLKELGPENVAFVFYGHAPPSKLLRDWLNRGVVHQPAVSFLHYAKVLKQLTPDVYLAPMADVPFSLSKSALRVMEGFAMGVPVVASPVGEYRCLKEGIDGYPAYCEDQWVRHLVKLVFDHERRLTMGAHARLRFEREFSWHNPACREPWVKVFDRIFELGE